MKSLAGLFLFFLPLVSLGQTVGTSSPSSVISAPPSLYPGAQSSSSSSVSAADSLSKPTTTINPSGAGEPGNGPESDSLAIDEEPNLFSGYEKFFKNLRTNSIRFSAFDKIIRALSPQEIITLHANIAKNPNNMSSRRFLGDHYYKQRQWQKVVDILGVSVESLPEASLNQLFMAYFERKDFRNAGTVATLLLALKNFQALSALQVVDHNAEVLRQMTSAEKVDDKEKKVLETLQFLRAQHLRFPKNILLYDRHLAFLEEFVQYFPQESLQVLAEMENKGLLQARHYSQICLYNHSAGYGKNAIISCNAALTRNPSEYRNRIWLGQALLYSGQEKDGKRALASVGQSHPESTAALEASAALFKDEKDLRRAMQYYLRIIQRPDASADAYLNLAEVAMTLKKYDTALMAFKRNCLMTKVLPQEFRRASGLLRKQTQLQLRFRSAMRTCNNRKKTTLPR